MVNLKGKHEVISILLPFKDEEAYIEACIQSIISQTDPHWELVIVDDHSTDASPQMVNRFAQKDARIRYFKNEGSGVINALQTAFKHSTGSLITRMDGDDIKTPDNLEELRQIVAPGYLAVGKVEYFREDGLGEGYANYGRWLNALTAASINFEWVYKECVVPSPCWLAYRHDFMKAGAFDSDLYPEDYDLCFRFYQSGLRIVGNQHIIHLWRDYATRTTRTSEHYLDNRFLHLKVHYFLEVDYNPERKLVLWGAGKKAKNIARKLAERSIAFQWITDNPKKIGHKIYGTVLEDSKAFDLNLNHDIIIGVSDPKGQEEIKRQTLNTNANLYWFC